MAQMGFLLLKERDQILEKNQDKAEDGFGESAAFA
jgi:hypothetical protein